MSDFTNALREVADFMDAHPNFPQPHYHTIAMYPGDIDTVRRALFGAGTWGKYYGGSWVDYTRVFGPDQMNGIKIELTVNREQVCTKIQTGTKIVPAQPAVEAVPEHEEPVYEWVCQ